MVQKKDYYYSYPKEPYLESQRTEHLTLEEAWQHVKNLEQGGLYVISMNTMVPRPDIDMDFPFRMYGHFEIDEIRNSILMRIPELRSSD